MRQDTAALVEDAIRHTSERDPDQPYRKWLWAAPASGGTHFLRQLETQMRAAGRRVIHLELPAYRFDAGEHALGQLCQHLGRDSGRDLDASRPLHTRIRAIARPLGRDESAPCILLRIPMSWLGRPRHQHVATDDAHRILRALLGSDLDAVVVSTQRPSWLGELLGEGQVLPALEAGDEFLLDATRWGSLSGPARRLSERLGISAGQRPPIDLGLGVACLAVGLDDVSVAAGFEAASPTSELVSMLGRAFEGRPTWGPALRRLSLPRFPVPAEIAERLAGNDATLREIAMICLARRDDRGVTFHEVLHGLAGTPEGHPEPEANHLLAEHWRALDSAPTAQEAIKHAIPWLEHIHHLGRSGKEGWRELQGRPILSRMSRYELAWSLSVEFLDYQLAAEIYRGLAEADDKDAYSHHYWAWNLDQAGQDGPTASREYRRAIDLEPDNPWYHSRFITFLLDNGFQADARVAFRGALKALAAAGVTARHDLPLNLHGWVARAALDAGDLVLAGEALAAVTPEQFKAFTPLRGLRDELGVLLEVDRLGEALYPASVSVTARWKDPVLLANPIFVEDPEAGCLTPTRLQRFHPGRVLAIDEDGTVELLLADPTQKPPVLFTREIARAALTRMAGGPAPEVGRFLELGTYAGDHHVVAYHPPSRYTFDRDEFLRGLRYLRDASGEEDA